MKNAGVKALFKQTKAKSPQDLVRSCAELLQALPAYHENREPKGKEKVVEEIAKLIREMKVVLYGDMETPVTNAEAVAQLVHEVFRGDFMGLLMQSVPDLPFDLRRDVAQVVGNLQRQQLNRGFPASDYLLRNPHLVYMCLQGYEDVDVALFYGSMFRDCLRHQPVAKYVLEQRNGEALRQLFNFLELPNFDISSDAASSFKELLTRHKTTVAEYLTANFDWFFERYNKLILSTSYITRRTATKMLADMFLDRANLAVTVRYMSSTSNMRIVMNLLKEEKSKTIQMEAFNIFKIFVMNSDKPQEIRDILAMNKEKLLRFLKELTPDKENALFEEHKAMVMQEIQSLPLPENASRSPTPPPPPLP
eukprot:TRINITY_DN3843_c0_g1_i1.p1 TRINITY_DN3843_c0_g1~~TRINITY_DN3843_c0_g1_i1.p1  ORF type:complete len:364 (-),score=105.71 TRINITY_DN3843_c0_g1_i1:144-1235(-)